MSKETINLEKDAKAIEQDLLNIRHDLHRFPEPSMHEYKTAGRIRDELDLLNLKWREVGGTGTLAKLEGAHPGPTIILRADIDALPLKEKSRYKYPSENEGYMHACGHDVHATALLGAAKLLSKYKDKLHGSVHFVFQQAEELGHGSQYFISENLTAGDDAIYGFHVTPDAPLGSAVLTDGTDAASCDYMFIKLYGKKSHIAKPHLGCDTTIAASDLVLRLQSLKASLNPMDNILIGIGRISSGNTWNIVADYAEIEGTVRAHSKESHDLAVRRTKELIDQVAALHNVRAEYKFETNTPCLVNHPEAYKVMKASAESVLGSEEKVIKRAVPLGFGGDDFAAFSEKIPGCFIHLGTALEDESDTKVPLHSDNIYITDDVIAIGAKLLTKCALSHLL